jgi:hypothetical protein
VNLQTIGAMAFGILIGWYVYYVNRYRPGDVQLSDIVTLIGILGGSAVLALFPSGSDLFAGYGIGLVIGFFGYFVLLVVFVSISPNFDVDWFLDGRRRNPEAPIGYPSTKPGVGAMGTAPDKPNP